MVRASTDSIDEAFNTFKDFIKVQKGNPQDVRLEAIDNFAQACGMDPRVFEYLCGELNDMVDSPGGELGWAIVGAMLGMLVAQFEADR